MTKITRRKALATALMGGAAACTRPREMTAYDAVSGASNETFAHGVASGDPAADSVVIWTRVSVDADAPVTVMWESAADAAFTDMRGKGEAMAAADADWTVKALLSDLEPGTHYYYRFRIGEVYSPVGRTKTLPRGSVDDARFAVISCSNFPFGYFNVYDLIARRDDLEAVIHLGDYIYEYGKDGYGGQEGEALGRPHDPPHEIVSLNDYRRRHAQYKADPCLQAAHAAHPFITIWDDHETADNAWAGGANNHQPETEGAWEDRKRAALQAYYEWMPIREPGMGRSREAIFRSYAYGDLLTLATLETRLMARAAPFMYNEIVPTLTTPEAVDEFRTNMLWDADREMLGAAQIDYIGSALRKSVADGQPWRLIANQVTMAKVTAPNLEPHVTEAYSIELESQWDQARAFIKFSTLGLPANLDAWDGYPAARERFYQTVREAGADGLVVVTGDTHTWWANDLVAEDGDHVGVELGVHSVTSPSPYRKEFLGGKGADYALLTTKENKDVRYLSGENHGYISLSVTREKIDATFMAVDTILAPHYNAFEQASFTIKKSGGDAKFASVRGLSLKERALF